jgi:hypothetical protein
MAISNGVYGQLHFLLEMRVVGEPLEQSLRICLDKNKIFNKINTMKTIYRD